MMPKPRHRLATAALVLLLVALAAVIVFWLRPQAMAPALPDGANALAVHDASPTRRADANIAMASTPITPSPLPSMAAPLALIVDELKTRSDAGDPDAACRLAAELAHCSHRDFQRADFDRWLAERQSALALVTEPEARSAAAANIAREMTLRETQVDQLSRHCEGSPAATPNDIAQQWRRAALLGSPAAMKQYASGNAFRWGSLMDSLPLLTTYRGEAESMAEGVARSGDTEMLLALATGCDPMPTQHQSLLSQSLSPDGARALAMYRRAQAALDAQPDGTMERLRRQLAARTSALESMLPPDDRSRALQIAEEELAGWATPVLDDSRRNQAGGQGDVSRFACGAPPGETVRRRRSPGQNGD